MIVAQSVAGRLARRLIRYLEKAPVTRGAVLELQREMFVREVWRLREHAGKLAAQAGGGKIMRGLFQGMRLHPARSWGFDQYTVLSGHYEQELQPIVARAVAQGYPCYIDIGCANGLYAVGLAIKAPGSAVVAYDLDPEARKVTRMNAELNEVAKSIDIRVEANWVDLSQVIGHHGSAFVICDIEGGEVDLIDPSACPSLLNTDLLIELHGDIVQLADLFSQRFAGTHQCRLIARSSRTPFEDDYLDFRWEDEMWIAVSEGREQGKNGWILLERSSVPLAT
jgi:SAM-dependent methyltransferase